MAEFSWLESNLFDLTLKRTTQTGKAPVDLFMLVEPDNGIEPNVASIISNPPFNFRTTGKGFWVTSSFIKKQESGKVSLALSDFGKALVTAGLHVRPAKRTKADLDNVYNKAIARRDIFVSKSKQIAFEKSEAYLLARNLLGEDVLITDSGERAISAGQTYLLASDAKTESELNRFLINGNFTNNIISIDTKFASDLINQEINISQTGSRWTSEDTINVINRLVKADASEADNIITVINELHNPINEAIYLKYEASIQPESIKVNGLLKSMKASTSIFSRLLPMYNESGDEIQSFESPTSIVVKRKIAETNSRVIEYSTNEEATVNVAIDSLNEGETLFAVTRCDTYALGQQSKTMIEKARDTGDLIGAFDLKDSVNNSPTSILRVFKFVKSTELAANANKQAIPNNLMSSSQFSETLNLVDFVISADKPLPLDRNELEDALKIASVSSLKEVKYEALTNFGTTPADYVVPASLAAPQRQAMKVFIDKFGEPANYVSTKLQMDIAKVSDIFSKLQIEHIAIAISRYEDGYGFVIGDGTGTGKTRQIAAIMRYQALNDEQIIFLTPDKSLMTNLWREIKLLEADTIIAPFVPTNEPIVDEDGLPVEFASGETSENHRAQLKEILRERKVIPGKYNAVFATYNTISAAPDYAAISTIRNFNGNFDNELPKRVRTKSAAKKSASDIDGPKARIYDVALCFEKFASRAETIIAADESHNATGQSNTRKAFQKINSACAGRIFASATSMKNAVKTEIYTEAMRVPFSPRQLVDILKAGGEPALEAFASSLTEEGGYVRAEMPRSTVKVKIHTDTNREPHYEMMNDAYASVMQRYLRLIAYITKAKNINNAKVTMTVGDKEIDITKLQGQQIGLNTTGFSSRFTKTNELFVACLKAQYIAEEAIEVIKQGGKAFIPLELTSESNLNYIREKYDMPKFSEKQIVNGELDDWIAIETAKNPDFTGFPSNFSDVLLRMFQESQNIKVKSIDDAGKAIVINVHVDTLITEQLSKFELHEYEALKEELLDAIEHFPTLDASPYDSILTQVRKAGYTAKAYSGRHNEIRETESGIKYLTAANTKECTQVREAFMGDNLDCVVSGRSGWTGVEWHAKHERPVTLLHIIPPTSADLDLQLQGRVNRTGQTYPPTIIHTSTGLMVEERIIQQGIQRIRQMNATSKGDANMDANADEVQLFSSVGIEAVKRYLYNNTHTLEKIGMSIADIETDYPGGASIATAATSRIQMLTVAESKEIMEQIDAEYYSLLNEMAEQGIEPFGQQIMDVEAKLSKAIKVGGIENSDNPWQQPVYIATATYSESLKITSSTDVAQKIANNHAGILSIGSEMHKVNNLNSTDRFNKFSKLLEQESDKTLKAIRQYTSRDIDDINASDGRLFLMKERFIRATEMSKLLSGMKLGQVVQLSTDQLNIGHRIEGVVTDIQMLQNGGYSPCLTISVPGQNDILASAITVDKMNITKTPIIYSQKSKLASDFDNAQSTVERERVVISGSAFPIIMTSADVLSSHGYRGANLCKIVNMTCHSETHGKFVQKVALMPIDLSIMDVISAPMKLTGPQATNYIKFAGDNVRTLLTAPSKKSANDSDLSLQIFGSDATGDRSIVISGLKKAHKKITDDNDLAQFGEPNENGDTGFASSSARSKHASITCIGQNIGLALTHLEQAHNIRFYSSNFGLKFINDFNNAMLPTSYITWLRENREDLLAMLGKQKDPTLDMDDIINSVQQATPTTVATP